MADPEQPWWMDWTILRDAFRYRELRNHHYVSLNPYTKEKVSGALLDWRMDKSIIERSPDYRLPWEPAQKKN